MPKQIIEKPMSEQCTMATYEAIADSDLVQYRDYTISDYPNDGANATQMAYALTCKRLFPEGTIIMFSGETDDAYTKGHCYQIKTVDESKTWVDITPAGEQIIPIITGTQDKPINLATDLEVNEYYLITGYLYKNSTSNIQLTSKFLVQKYESTSYYVVIIYGGNFQNGTITSTASLCNSKIFLRKDNTGELNIGGNKALGISIFNGTNPIFTNADTIQSLYAPIEAGTSGQILKSNGLGKAPSWIDNPAPRTISNTIVSNWVADTTYTDFGYKADMSITNLTENDTCEVIFNQADASSGNYAQVNSSSAGTLTIYSKVNTEITIPTIIIIKGGN